MYINYYLSDHDDSIAEYVGDVLEQMGICSFRAIAKKKMNVYGRFDEVKEEIRKKINSKKFESVRVNLVVFFTKWIEDSIKQLERVNELIEICKNTGIFIYVVTDDHMRGRLYEAEETAWAKKYATHIHVEDTMWDLGLMNLVRILAVKLVMQEHNLPERNTMEILSDIIFTNFFKDEFLTVMFEKYRDIPEADKHTRFVVMFTIYKYVATKIIKASSYTTCIDFLYKRDSKELLVSEEDIEMVCLCTVNDLLFGQRKLSVV